MLQQAEGTFDVKLTPQPLHDAEAGPMMGRLTMAKTFHGDLDGASRGEMLSAGTAVEGSAGYVAMEAVEGTLHGRRGGFALQHSGSMDRGAPSLTVSVVPDSGTGELAGLVGTMTIAIDGGEHRYVLEYELAGSL